MARTIDMGRSRRIDAWLGLVLCGLLYALARVRARMGGPPLPRWGAPTPPGPAGPPPRRVLAIKLWGLGNLVMIVPVLDALRRAAPGVEIDFLTLESNRALLARSGVVDRIVGFEVRSHAALLRSLGAALRALRARRYDLVLDFEQFAKLSAILAYASGAPRRIGFDTDGQGRGALFTTRVAYADGEHMREIFLRLLRPLGIEPRLRPPRFAIEPAERTRVSELLSARGIRRESSPLVAIHPGSGPSSTGVPLKRWPPESFAALADALALRHGASVVFSGQGDEERALVREVRSRMQQPSVDACDELALGELLALLEICDFVVSNDTSVMHLAAAVATPVAALFGPTHPQQYGPWNPGDLVFWSGLHCSPCLTNYNQKVSRCPDPVCIRAISAAQVLEAIEKRFLAPDSPLRRRAPQRA